MKQDQYKCPYCRRWIARCKILPYFRQHSKGQRGRRYDTCTGSHTACAGEPKPRPANA